MGRGGAALGDASTIAAKTLISLFEMTVEHIGVRSQKTSIAVRLGRLLPEQGDGRAPVTTGTASPGVQGSHLWLVWLGFALAISSSRRMVR